MTEETESSVLTGAADTDSSVLPAAVSHETSLCEVFENTLEISQDVGLTEAAASEETDNKEKLEQEDGQRDGQMDRQLDGQTVSPPAAEPSSPQSKWVVGAACQTVWSEDGLVYPAKVVSVDGERCRVRFSGYGNEEEVELSALRSPDAARQTQRQNCQDWRPGSRCRAVFSEDGLVYPAVVLWVKGQRCRVRFDDYNNEEEQDVSNLLNPDELHGPARAAAATAKGSGWRSSLTSNSSNTDWKRRRREENQGDRGAERRTAWRDEQHSSSSSSSSVKDKSGHSKVEKESEEKKKPTNHCFPFFPPFPPPQSSSGDPVSFVPPPPPPPPPLWSFGGKDVDASSSMLMLWYLCGFHTGSYLAQQEFKSSSKP